MITPRVSNKTTICEQASNHGSYFAYARLIARVTFKLVWCKTPKTMNSVQKFLIWELFCTEFLHFARSAKITAFYMAKSHGFVFF